MAQIRLPLFGRTKALKGKIDEFLDQVSEAGMVLEQPYQLPEKMPRRLRQVRLAGEWLMISTRDQTFAIPMMVDG